MLRRARPTEFAFRLHLHQHLLLPHDFDHLADIAAWLLKYLQPLSGPYGELTSGIQSISLRFQSPKILGLLGNIQFGSLDLVLVVSLRRLRSASILPRMHLDRRSLDHTMEEADCSP